MSDETAIDDQLERALAAARAEAARAEEPAAPAPAPSFPARVQASGGRALIAPPFAEDVLARDLPPLRVYSTGIPTLDARLHTHHPGLETQALHVVISRTGAGKTGFALGVLLHNARLGVPGLYIGAELPANEAAVRLGALALGRPHGELLFGATGRAEARAAIAGLPIRIVGADEIGIGDAAGQAIAAAIDSTTAAHGIPPIIVIDYMQLLPEVTGDPRGGMTEAARGLRAFAQSRDCVIIGVSSCARAFYRTPEKGGDDPQTYLGAAKESGDIEFAAWSVTYLDVDSEHIGGVYRARLVVAKARRGSVGFVGAQFDGPSGRWAEDVTGAAAMTAEARVERGQQRKHEGDDEAVLQAIRDAATGGVQRTERGWRRPGNRPIGDHRTRDAIARLVEAGRLAQLPDPKSTGQLVVPADMVPPIAPIDPTSIAARGGFLVGASA